MYLGKRIGIGGNGGGVGFGMLLLIWANSQFKDTMPGVDKTKNGILFWSAMYIPVVIAMSATLNVRSAVSGGWVAVLAGILATGTCYFLIPVIAGMVKRESNG